MPKVGKKKFPYTKKGRAAAKRRQTLVSKKAKMKRMTPYGGSRKS